ncbi:MAG: hypothetical protein EXR53_06190 [Dehalococcoidia bacterium]|nr:hypothetical protein [Dehalococcoidia bacterium]
MTVLHLTVPLTGIGEATQSGQVVLTATADKTEVVINVKPGPAGVAQPAHIHDTECQLPPKVTYPLSNVVDGKSTTVVNATSASLQDEMHPFAVCIHKSVAEITTYVAVGAIPFTVPAAPTPTPTRAPAAVTPTTFQVKIENLALLNITVPAGTALTWVNGDTVAHVVGSGKDGKFDSGGWKSPTLNAGQSYSQTFSATGAFSYTCQVHPTLNATVTVAAPGTPPSSTPASSGGSDYY